MPPSMRIAVAGATGRVGSRVVELLEASGYDVVPISRSTGVDVVTGEGLAGVECVIDAASGTARGPQRRSPTAASEFFTASTRNLHGVGHKVGVQRVVEVSVLGIDRFTAGQGAAKYAHEKAMLAGPIPVRVLRAAQFHEMVPQLIEWGIQLRSGPWPPGWRRGVDELGTRGPPDGSESGACTAVRVHAGSWPPASLGNGGFSFVTGRWLPSPDVF